MEAVTVRAGEEVVCGSLAQIKHQFSYLSHYHDNLANLSSKLQKLEGERSRVQREVNRAENNLEEIEVDVVPWLEKVDVTRSEINGILEERNEVGNGCWKGWCLNLKPRYSLSRKAVKKANDLDALLAVGEFKTVSRGQRPLGVVSEPTGSEVASYTTAPNVFDIASTSTGTSGGFPSRLSTMREIMEALMDDSIRMVRICGMGGVGKTTMAKEVEKMAREKLIFQEIAKAEFTKEPDVGRIQGDLAKSVGLKLEEDNFSARADRLHDRLNNQNKKILLILDNVWRREDLERVGIPLDEEKMSCKILLTSRSEDVCADLRIQTIFRIGVLSDQEAQILFLKSVNRDLDAHMNQVAKDIVKKCGGLPIAIKTIGMALANKSEVSWDDVLGQLKKSTLQGEYAAVNNCLQTSYDFLEPEEMKHCFLLCCLFPEGFDVPIEDIVRYGKARRLFKIDNVQDARTRVHAHVEKLVNSNLLLVSDRKERVKMHDLVRDFALSTASKGLYMVKHARGPYGLKEWPMEDEDTCQNYTSISLQCKEMDELPNGLDYPKLKLLKLVTDHRLPKFPEIFYEGMPELNVLAFSRMFVPLAPSPVQLLTNLRTLSINDIWSPCDISTIVNLENLEVLSLAGSIVKHIPKETGKFSKLRLLDLTKTKIVDGFPSGVLSCLIRLEELYLRGCCPFWFDESAEKEQAKIAEIKLLSKLLVIDIDIRYDVSLTDFPFENLERFKISILLNASASYYHWRRGYKLELVPYYYTYRFKNTLKLIVDKSVFLRDGFKALLMKTKILDLEMKGLEIFQRESEKGDFSNLEILSLASCNELVYLVNTKQLDRKDVFPNLCELYLYNLNNLEAIYHVEHSKESSSGITEMELPVSPHSLVEPAQLATFGNLGVLDVRDCNKLEYIFSSSIARGLVLLEHLKIVDCKMIRAIFSEDRGDEDETAAAGKIEFPHLKYLELVELPKLTSLFTEANISVSDQQANACAMTPLFNQKYLNTVGGFQNLRSIIVKSCSSLRAVVGAEGEEEEECAVKGILFPQLNDLCLVSLPNLLSIMPKTCTFNWSSLKKLRLEDLGGEFDLFANMIGIQKGTSGQKYLNTVGGFQNLRSIVVKSCSSLRLLFTPSMALLFKELQHLELQGCESLRAVVGAEGEEEEECEVKGILFPQLNDLCLVSLPNLLSIMPKTCTINWSSLKKLTLEDCGGESDLFANMIGIQKGTSGQKTALTSLEYMEINNMNLNMLWSNLFLAARCSFGLKKLKFSDCDTPATISHLIQGFDHLEVLDVESCDSLEIAFDLEELIVGGEHKVVPLHRLDRMYLFSLRNMTHVWKIGPQGFQGFQNLTSLSMWNCDIIKYSLSPVIAKSLVKLRDIRIRNCRLMEEVILNRDKVEEEDQGNAVVDDMIFLPELYVMELSNLPSLVCIGPGAFASYDKLSLGAPGGIGSTETTHHEVIGTTLIPSPTSNEEKSSSAASGTLEGSSQRQLPTWSLCYPKRLQVFYCHKMLHVISSNTVAGLQKLDDVRISNCDSMVEIFEVDGMDIDEEHALTIPKLRGLKLDSLPKLMYIWRSKLSWVLNFPNLKKVEISRCDSMRYLFCSSTVRSLAYLEVIIINNCKMMEIIVKEEDEVEAAAKGESNRTIKLVLPCLARITLQNLPNLRGICLGLLDFELPSLNFMDIKECPEMRIFTNGCLSAPNLEKVSINSSEYSLEGDLNTFLKQA